MCDRGWGLLTAKHWGLWEEEAESSWLMPSLCSPIARTQWGSPKAALAPLQAEGKQRGRNLLPLSTAHPKPGVHQCRMSEVHPEREFLLRQNQAVSTHFPWVMP